jgi:hypothetical protein
MDDLDREIEEAARLARSKVWRARRATIASTATLLIVGLVGAVVMFKLFPEPDVDEFDWHRQEMKARKEEPGAMMLVGDTAAQGMDWARMRLKMLPVVVVAFTAAVLVSRRLKAEG